MEYTETKKKILADNIWVRRELLNLSKDDLANILGCTNATISNWERGATIPTKKAMRALSKALNCSINELHREYRIPTINFSGQATYQKKEEQIMLDSDIISSAKEAFKDSFTESSGTSISEEQHPVVARLNKYMKDTGLGSYIISNESGISSGTIHRIKNGALKYSNKYYTLMEEFLDKVEGKNKSGGVKVGSGPEPYKCKLQPVQETVSEPTVPTKEKGSISERLNDIYDVLFNAMAELDELKADIAKIEKVTAMLKEIQGL